MEEIQQCERMDKAELAALLGWSVLTVRRKENKNPEHLPPFIALGPTGRTRFYLRSTVMKWLHERQGVGGVPVGSTPTALAAKSRRGRPRKSERLGKEFGGVA